MLLMTKELAAKVPPLYANEDVEDPMVWVKYFDPCGSWSWFMTEYDPAENLAFGLVDGLEVELGYFSLDEMAAYRSRFGLGIERDLHFKPTPLSVIRQKIEERRR